jgi:hypothetical protein
VVRGKKDGQDLLASQRAAKSEPATVERCLCAGSPRQAGLGRAGFGREFADTGEFRGSASPCPVEDAYRPNGQP